MKKVIYTVIFLAALGSLYVLGSAGKGMPSQETAAARSAFFAPQTHYDFGTISMKEGKVSRLFALQNPGTETAVIEKITTSCMCTEAFVIAADGNRKGPFGMPGHGFVPPVNETVPVGGNLGIEVIFDPAAHGPAGIGRVERAVFIEDADGGVQVVTIAAFVTP